MRKRQKYLVIFAIVTLLCSVVIQPFVALAKNLDSSGIVDKVELSKTHLNDGEHVKFTVDFSEKDDVQIESGDTIELDLPHSDDAYIQGFNKTFDLKDDQGNVLGTVVIKEEKVVVTFNEEASSLDHVKGTFYFTAEARNTKDSEEGSTIKLTTNFGIPTLKEQDIEITRAPSVGGTYPPFYKVGTMYPNDTEHVQWWLNFNLDHRTMTEDGYIEDKVMPGHDMDWSTFEITINQQSPSLSKEEFIKQGYGDIEYIDGNPEHYYIRLDKDKLKDASVVVSYKTKITEPEQDSFENQSKVWYRFENGEHAAAEDNNSTVQNIFAGGGAQGDPTQKEVKFVKENQRNQALKGAKLQLKDTTDDKVIETWTTTTSTKAITLSKGHYYVLEELEAPVGYEKAEPITFRVTAYGLVEVKQADGSYKKASQATVKMIDKPTVKNVSLRKVGSDKPETLLEGATLQLKNLTTNEIVETFKTDANPHSLSVNCGDMYVLSEVDAPEGYDVADNIVFQVKQDGTILIKGKDGQFTPLRGQTIMMVDAKKAPEKTLIMVRKLSQNKVTPVKGAKLKIINAETEEEVASFESGTDAYKISLENGKKYRLIEEEAPKGYEKAEPIDFELTKEGELRIDGKVVTDNTVKMYDLRKEQTYPFKKLDEANHYVKGAKMVLRNRSTHMIEKEWTTGETSESLTLKVGQIYELMEEEAPEGYKVADPLIILVKEDGTLLINDKASQSKELEMIDVRLKTDVSFAKKDDETKALLKGATFKLTNTTLNQSQEFTSEEIATVLSLPNDCYYRLEEVTAPDGYTKADPIDFVIRSNGRVQIKQGDDYVNADQELIEIMDKRQKLPVKVEKRDAQSHLLLENATLKLTDVTADKEVETWQTTNEAKTLDLTYGHRYQLEEVTAPDGYLVADSIMFDVTMDGKVKIDDKELDTATITMNDERLGSPLKFKKVDAEGNVVKGAKMALYNKSDHLSVEEFVTTDDVKTLNLKRKQSYVLKELEAPEGYQLADDIEITVLDSGKILVNGEAYQKDTLNMVDARLTAPVAFEKRDAEGDQYLEGAKLKIIDDEGKEVASWTSGKEAKDVTLEYGKTYQFIEVSAPEGYDIAQPITFRLTMKGEVQVKEKDEFVSVDKVTMTDHHRKKTLAIDKQSFDKHERLANAKLQLIDQTDNKVIDTWTTTKEPKQVSLTYGHHYELKELEAPEGYLIADAIHFDVLMDGQIVLENKQPLNDDVLTMYDKHRGVPLQFEKNDELGHLVSGAKIEVIHLETGKVIQTITKPNETLQLKTGQHYELVEVETPDGYQTADKIRVEVADDGSVKVNGEEYHRDTIYMIDPHRDYNIKLDKIDGQTKASLEGAHLVLKDLSTGKVVENFVSGKEAKEITLPWGHRYQIEEEKAPQYYEALEEPIVFEIAADGEIKVDGQEPTKETIHIENYRQKRDVAIDKLMPNTNQPVENAVLELFEGDEKIASHVTTKEAWTVTLEAGKEYRLSEKQAPIGYAKAADIMIKVDENGDVWQKDAQDKAYRKVDRIKMEDTPFMYILKTDKATNLPLAGASLQIIDAKTEEAVSKVWKSQVQAMSAIGLEQNHEYLLVEKETPKGYRLAEPIRFKLDDEWQVLVYDHGQWKKMANRLVTMQDEKEVVIPWIPLVPATPTDDKPDDNSNDSDDNSNDSDDNSNDSDDKPDSELDDNSNDGSTDTQPSDDDGMVPPTLEPVPEPMPTGHPAQQEVVIQPAMPQPHENNEELSDLPQTGTKTNPVIAVMGVMLVAMAVCLAYYELRKYRS